MLKKLLQANKKYLRISIYALLVLALAIAWEKFLANPTVAVGSAVSFLGHIKRLLLPFIYGFCIAYLINPLVRRIQSLLSKTGLSQDMGRVLSILASYVLVFGIMVWLATVFIPEFVRTVNTFIITVPQSLMELEKNANALFNSVDFLEGESLMPILNSIVNSATNWAKELAPQIQQEIPNLLQKLAAQTMLVASGLFSIIMSLFISFYMLSGKEGFVSGLKKIGYALINPNKVERFFYNMGRINQIFQSFIVGKTLDSLIIGVLCFIGVSIIRSPVPLLISVIVGVTNMIPYFGPFIGAIPSVLIVLLVDPIKAIWVLIFIIVLQQFDGNYLGPKILGESTGLGPLWVILSITVGGSLMGPLGMFIGVPTCGALKLFFDEYIDRKYADKYAAPAAEAAPSSGDSNKT